MIDVFATWVNFILQQEGGFTDDPNDPGGPTNFGLIASDGIDPHTVTRDQAIAVYRTKYWTATKADQLPPAVAIVYADAAVNQGAFAAAKMLQQAAGVTVDGNVGPATINAAIRANPHDLSQELTARRLVRYATTAHFDHFGLGWMRRAVAALTLSSTL